MSAASGDKVVHNVRGKVHDVPGIVVLLDEVILWRHVFSVGRHGLKVR
jgi:hypothetical protein